MKNRHCESCTACCEGWIHSKVIGMKPGKSCVHCTTQGCAIYDARPVEPCATFKCAWLADDSPLPDDMRPSDCGAIVILTRKWQGKPMIVAAPVGEKIPKHTLDWLMEYARQNSIPLLFNENLKEDDEFTGYKKLGYGPPWFIYAVENEIVSEDLALF